MPESTLIDPNERRMKAVLDALAHLPEVRVLVSVHDADLEPLAAARYPADRRRHHVPATDYAPAHDFFVTRVRVGAFVDVSFHGGRLPPA